MVAFGLKYFVMTKQPQKIILASASPRRSMLLKRFISDFTVRPADIDETITEGVAPAKAAIEIARKKAEKAAENSTNEEFIIAADTIVVLNGKIYGKPENIGYARQYLHELRNKTHVVITAVCCIDMANKKITEFTQTTSVTFTDYDDVVIEKYINSGEPMDRAGAYAIQGIGSILVKEIHGDYDNVVGLPIAELMRQMKWYT